MEKGSTVGQVERRVLLLCGPAGAGKTTWARGTGLTVYDRDDPVWRRSEKLFRRGIMLLARDPAARAVVIRAGASRSARARAARLIGATEVVVMATPADECRRRVIERKRDHPPMRAQIQSIVSWWQRYEPGDVSDVVLGSPEARGSTKERGYGYPHRRAREAIRPSVERGETSCSRCGQAIQPGQPWDLDHTPDRSGYLGPAHRACNRAAGARVTNVRRRRGRRRPRVLGGVFGPLSS